MRKVFIGLLVALVIGAAAISVYYVFLTEEEFISDTLYDAIPLDAGIITDIRDFDRFCSQLQESNTWGHLCNLRSVAALNDDILLLDSLSKQHAAFLPFRQHVIFSLHPSGKEEVCGIGYVKMNSEKEAKGVIDRLKGQTTGKAVVSERSYDHVNITDVSFSGQSSQNFSCAYRNGIFLFSRSSLLLENAVRQIVADHNITHGGKLSELIQTAGNSAPANIYINYSQLPRIVSGTFHARQRRLIGSLAHFADWTELDLNLKPDQLLFNGFTASSPLPEHWSSVFRSQRAMPVTLTDVMPSTTYAYFWLGINQLQQYFSDYSRYLEHYKETSHKKELNRVNNTFRVDLQKDFTERFENEAAIVYAHIGQAEEAPFKLFRIKSTLSAVEMLEEWQAAVKKQNANAGQTKAELQFDHQLKYTAYKFPFDIPANLFGDVFSGDNDWCVVADNYMVFGRSPADLKKYLHYTALHASLQTDINYGKIVNHFATRSNVIFYCNPSLSAGLLENVLNAGISKEITETDGILSRMQTVLYQLSNNNGMLYNHLLVKCSSGTEPSPAGSQTSWESLLDTAILFKPQLVQNHNTGETEVFVQDMANNIYLLNNVGRILWKVSLPEQILSPIYQIDIYRNGKLQMLFSTRNYIYVVDRLGNFVEKYPLKLKSPAVGGVAVFDYDKDRKYRMMIACEDRKVYMYDKTGKAVDGWSFRQTEHPVRTDIYHYRVNNKDYLVFADKYRVYILDRQGRTRVSPEYNLPVANNTVIALDQPRTPGQSRLVLADTTGTVHFISLANGKIQKQQIKAFPSSHFFVYQDVDGDRQGDFIFAADNKLEVFGQNGKQILSVTTEEPITMRPYIYEFSSSDIKIGIVQPQNNHIFLYNKNGKVHKGFPLTGSTLFSVGRLDKNSVSFNLFVGSKNNFLYNYSVK